MLVAAVALASAAAARAQTCCSGSSVLTPGRLAPYESWLVGLQARGSVSYGAFDAAGRYAASPSGTREIGAEQDLFGSARFLRNGQITVLVPFVETARATPTTAAETGAGIGDVNASVRWDLVVAGHSRVVPGVGLLFGLTFPTGRPPESARNPLATDATGTGALQGNVGLSFEQTFGPWLVNLTGIVAQRSARDAQGVRSVLGPQLTSIAALAYAFPKEAAAALTLSYTVERDARVDGRLVPNSGRALLRVGAAGSLPLADWWRLQPSVFFDPPVSRLGQSQPAAIGVTIAVIRSWS
jgi:hypothetical protein